MPDLLASSDVPDADVAPGDALRLAMRRVPAPVTVVTGRSTQGQIGAATIGSFTSVSLTPPLVSFNVFRGSALNAALDVGAGFVVHVLHDGQAELAARFAHPDLSVEDRLRLSGVPKDEHAAPVLPDALTRLHGIVRSRLLAGDHHLYLGEITRVEGPLDGDPLVYLDRTYGTFRDEQRG